MVRNIVRLLSEEQRRRGVWVVFSVLTRAILDFAGIAALVPILLIVVKDGGRSMMLAVLYVQFMRIGPCFPYSRRSGTDIVNSIGTYHLETICRLFALWSVPVLIGIVYLFS